MKLNIFAAVTIAALSLSTVASANYGSGKAPQQAAAVQKISSGSFSGRSDHVTTGTATLVKTGKGYKVVLSGDFELDGAPDPIVAVGNGETYVAANKLGALKNRTGAQSYELPANITPAQFSQVYIWCEKFSVPLGVATLGAKPAPKAKYGS